MTARKRRVWLLAAVALAPSASGDTGSAACADCHREIYDRYSRTPMAASSGPIGGGLAAEQFARAEFTHQPTGFRYRVYRKGKQYFLEYRKTDGSSQGTKPLAWFVGSGATARSYVLADDGFLFEAPVAYYAQGSRWDLAPNYDRYAYPYLTRPVQPGCLTCHASFLKPLPGTQNRFASPPFGEPGIACERCHGSGERHIALMRAGRSEGGAGIVNPATLPAEARDSICGQCHLPGEVRVMRPGRDWRSFQPGDRLSASMTVFVRSSAGPGMTVTGHVEKLAQSACKRSAGDRLWCGSCHDPHSVPRPADRAQWFRGKCLACHEDSACTETRAARLKRADDCTTCHMPKNAVVDAQHVVYTDHSIPRRPRRSPAAVRAEAGLVPFGGGPANPRDLALAYAIAAPRDSTGAWRSHALAMLQQAERESPDDVEVLMYLGELYRNGRQPDLAVPLFERAIGLDPGQVTASVGLGGIMMERARYADAIRLWEDALAKNAGLELVRTNLAMAYWRSGNLQAAESHLKEAVDLNPGFDVPAGLLKQLRRP